MSDLDLFGNPITAPTPIIKSAKDIDDALQVVWRPYKGPDVPCQDCVSEMLMRRQVGVNPTKWVRRDVHGETHLCYKHKFESQDRENRGGQ